MVSQGSNILKESQVWQTPALGNGRSRQHLLGFGVAAQGCTSARQSGGRFQPPASLSRTRPSTRILYPVIALYLYPAKFVETA